MSLTMFRELLDIYMSERYSDWDVLVWVEGDVYVAKLRRRRGEFEEEDLSKLLETYVFPNLPSEDRVRKIVLLGELKVKNYVTGSDGSKYGFFLRDKVCLEGPAKIVVETPVTLQCLCHSYKRKVLGLSENEKSVIIRDIEFDFQNRCTDGIGFAVDFGLIKNVYVKNAIHYGIVCVWGKSNKLEHVIGEYNGWGTLLFEQAQHNTAVDIQGYNQTTEEQDEMTGASQPYIDGGSVVAIYDGSIDITVRDVYGENVRQIVNVNSSSRIKIIDACGKNAYYGIRAHSFVSTLEIRGLKVDGTVTYGIVLFPRSGISEIVRIEGGVSAAQYGIYLKPRTDGVLKKIDIIGVTFHANLYAIYSEAGSIEDVHIVGTTFREIKRSAILLDSVKYLSILSNKFLSWSKENAGTYPAIDLRGVESFEILGNMFRGGYVTGYGSVAIKCDINCKYGQIEGNREVFLLGDPYVIENPDYVLCDKYVYTTLPAWGKQGAEIIYYDTATGTYRRCIYIKDVGWKCTDLS